MISIIGFPARPSPGPTCMTAAMHIAACVQVAATSVLPGDLRVAIRPRLSSGFWSSATCRRGAYDRSSLPALNGRSTFHGEFRPTCRLSEREQRVTPALGSPSISSSSSPIMQCRPGWCQMSPVVARGSAARPRRPLWPRSSPRSVGVLRCLRRRLRSSDCRRPGRRGARRDSQRDYYSYLHLPMIAGIVLFALGLKKTVEHVGEPLATVPQRRSAVGCRSTSSPTSPFAYAPSMTCAARRLTGRAGSARAGWARGLPCSRSCPSLSKCRR